jgi:hypothetical protein
MTLKKWDQAVRLAKIKHGLNPDNYTMLRGKLLKEAQAIYQLLIISK